MIKRDQKMLMRDNRVFLSKKLEQMQTSFFLSIKQDVDNKINANVFDRNDKEELKIYLKELFCDHKMNSTILNFIEVKGSSFKFEIGELLPNSTSSLIQNIYPTLENSLKAGFFPVSFLEWKKSIRTACYLNYLKAFKSELANVGKPFDGSVFRSVPCQDFFIFLVDSWIKKEPNKNTVIRFVFNKMNDKEEGYNILATGVGFAKYWNLNYSDVYVFSNEEMPRMKNHISKLDYYEKSFQDIYDKFKKVK